MISANQANLEEVVPSTIRSKDHLELVMGYLEKINLGFIQEVESPL
jgi:hypothetical protein